MAPRQSNTKKKTLAEQDREQRAKESKIEKFFIPKNSDDWRQLAKRARYSTIQQLPAYCIAFGSKTTDCQYLAYRALSKDLRNKWRFMSEKHHFGITDEIWQAAEQIMNGSNELPKFLALLKEETHSESLNESHELWPGSWLSVKTYQEKITRQSRPDTEDSQAIRDIIARYASSIRSQHSTVSPFIAPEIGQKEAPEEPQGFREEPDPGIARGKAQFPDAEDEVFINTYMVILLEQSGRVPNHQLAEWTMKRISLSPSIYNDKSYKALTDGALRLPGGKGIHASVEVKKAIRSSNDIQTTKQEVSQLVAMVQEGHPAVFGDHWLVIGQSRHEIYLRFATCPPENYREYLKTGRVVSDEVWLLAKPYGPWIITKATQMQNMVQIFLSLTLVANLAIADELSSEEEDRMDVD